MLLTSGCGSWPFLGVWFMVEECSFGPLPLAVGPSREVLLLEVVLINGKTMESIPFRCECPL